MKVLISLTALALLAGCGHTPEPEIRTVEVKVPVPVPCRAEVDVRETYTDDNADAQPGIFDKVRALLIGRSERREDAAKLKAAVAGCGGTVR